MKFDIQAYSKNGVIVFNHDELKKQLKDFLESFEIAPDYLTAKQQRASLNKLIKDLESRRIEVKKIVMHQYTSIFEPQIKELVGMIEQITDKLEKTIGSVEVNEAEYKRKEILDLWASLKFDLVPLDKFWNEKWLNKTYWIAHIENEMREKIKQINLDMYLLREIDDALIPLYLTNLDLEATKEYHKTKLNLAAKQGQEVIVNQTKARLHRVKLSVVATEDMLKSLGEFMRKNGYIYEQTSDLEDYTP
jgi:hypothetical protein